MPKQTPKQESIDLSQVQANILLPYEKANCARMLFFRFDPEKLCEARAWVRELAPRITFHGDRSAEEKEGDEALDEPVVHRFARGAGGGSVEDGKPCVNVGFTYRGLQALGFDPFTMKYLPEDFQQGMRARATRLGDDLRQLEHVDPHDPDDHVHAVVLVYARSREAAKKSRTLARDLCAWDDLDVGAIEALEGAVAQTLDSAVEMLPASDGALHLGARDRDMYVLQHGDDEIEYFGFPDGISQPRIAGVPDPAPAESERPEKPGLVLLGLPRDGSAPTTRGRLALEHLRHGSFLAIRQLAQDVEGFRSAMDALAPDPMTGKDLAAQMMGRHQDGTPLVETGEKGRNDFTYEDDQDGVRCPFQSHIRRTNPRDRKSPLRRMMRRSLPYSSHRTGGGEQGLMFQSYNSSLEVQFEFVQRQWVGSGTENKGLSADRDPIVGEQPREDAPPGGGTFTFTSPADHRPKTLTGLSSFVTYRGGDYFLVPSRRNLHEIGQDPASPLTEYHNRVEGLPQARARDVLGRWLDDIACAKRIWKEVRDRGGVVRLDQQEEDCVLVGAPEFIETVLRDDGSRYSVCQQGRGMSATTGPFYLGMDACDPRYQEESQASFKLISGWKSDPPADPSLSAAKVAARAFAAGDDPENQAELEQIKQQALALCLGYLGVSVTEAVADRKQTGDPARGTFNVLQYVSYVLSGMVPRLFGVPQPSIAGTFKMFVPSSGAVFFAFPQAEFLEYADQASEGISLYLASLFDERQRRRDGTLYPPGADGLDGPGKPPDERDLDAWEERLDDTLTALESIYQNRDSGRPWSRDDSVRTMAGIISGMLVASFKLFLDGVSIFAKRSKAGDPLQPEPALIDYLPFEVLAEEGLSMPNVLYRVSRDTHKLNRVEVWEGDLVLACQGSAMGDLTNDRWFYGDRTPTKAPSVLAPHFCPGFRAADAMLSTMSQVLFSGGYGVADLRRVDEEGLELEYDWKTAHQFIENVKKMMAAAHGG